MWERIIFWVDYLTEWADYGVKAIKVCSVAIKSIRTDWPSRPLTWEQAKAKGHVNGSKQSTSGNSRRNDLANPPGQGNESSNSETVGNSERPGNERVGEPSVQGLK